MGHHLRILERDGVVALARVGRTVHAAPVEYAKKFSGLDVLACPETRHTLAVLYAATMGRGATELGRVLDLTRKQVRRHLHELIDGGLARTDGAYHPRYYATERGEHVAQRLAVVDFGFKDAVEEAVAVEERQKQDKREKVETGHGSVDRTPSALAT